MFEEKGIIIAEGNGLSLEAAMDNAIEIGAEDVEEEEDSLVVSCFLFRIECFFTHKEKLPEFLEICLLF